MAHGSVLNGWWASRDPKANTAAEQLCSEGQHRTNTGSVTLLLLTSDPAHPQVGACKLSGRTKKKKIINSLAKITAVLQKEGGERAKCAASSTGVHIFSTTQALVEAEISAGNKEQTTNALYQWMRSLLRYWDKTEAPLCCSALCLHRTELVSEMKSWNQLRWGAVKGSRIKAPVRHSRNQLWLSQQRWLLRRSWHKAAPTLPAAKAPPKHTLAQRQKCDISVHSNRQTACKLGILFFWELYFKALF